MNRPGAFFTNPTILRTISIILLMALLLGGCNLPVKQTPQVEQPPAGTKTGPIAGVPTAEAVEPSATIAPVSPLPVPTQTARPAQPPLLPAPLYFLSARSGSSQIWRIEMNGGMAHQVTNMPDAVTDFDVSAVDGRLVYISGNNLFLAASDGSQSSLVIPGEPVADPESYDPTTMIVSPRWSPDGKYVAYALNGINVMETDQMQSRLLVSNTPFTQQNVINGRYFKPVFWSLDGSRLGAAVGYYEGMGLAIVPVNGGEPVFPEVSSCCDVTPGPDAQTFYLASAEMAYTMPGLWRVRWDNGQLEQVSPLPSSTAVDIPLYAFPKLGTDGRLYFLYGSSNAPQVVSADSSAPASMKVLDQLSYFPGSALWAPDGKLAVFSGRKETDPLQVWIPGQALRPLEVSGSRLTWGFKSAADISKGSVPAPTATPQPTLVPLPASSQAITVQNAPGLQPFTRLESGEKVYGLAISPDGRWLALGLDTSVHLWDLQSLKQAAVLGPYGGIIPALDFSPDSRFLAVGSWDSQVDLWDTASQQKTLSFSGHTDTVNRVRFSPDGSRLASAANDNQLILWDTTSGKQTQVVNMGSWGSDVVFSPDGSLLAVARWNMDVMILNTATGNQFYSISRPSQKWILNLKYSPDGKTLVMGDISNNILLWDTASQSGRNELSGHTDNPTGLAFSPDGSLFASAAEDGDLRLWDFASGTLIHRLVGERMVVFSPDGRFIMSPDKGLSGVVIWYIP